MSDPLNYSVVNFVVSVDLSDSKFERVILKLFNFVENNYWA